MHNRLIVLLVFLLASFSSAAYGLADWSHPTPGGNTLYNAGSGTTLALRKSGTELEGITGWYFYKHHIIGNTHSGYFIINEINADTRSFASHAEWEDYIKGAGLQPRLWTRWYTDNWRFYEQSIFPLVFMVLFVLFPALTYFVLTMHEWLSGGAKLQVQRKPLIIAAGLLLLSVVRFLLDLYPQSY